ncbi:MAG: beta-ketoacyl synthase N-terminal-like domain-containing protein [Planctomycetota bacterium]
MPDVDVGAEDVGANDIAIVGMGLRLPGALRLDQYWQNLRDGVESVDALTDDELREAGVPARLLKDPRYVKAGVRLPGFDHFDAEFFGFSPKEAAIMDPQHRQFLECCWEALEDAAHPPSGFDGPIGVFAGCGMGSYFAHNVLRNRRLMDEVGLFLLRHTGNDKDFLATRVSYCLDLKGPSVNVQTACSTSLVAVHLAAQSLLSGESDMCLAGGVTIDLPHGQGYLYKENEILSPDGHCRAFDHRSRGTIFGSGAGVVVLRRLADAIADRDHIYAVVKGTAVNNDGASKVGYLAPSVDGQAAAIAEALALSDVDPDQVDYVECHGTGTEIGDPIEVSALTQAFASSTRKQYCGIGSVKTNIGHLDTAAGVASLIKVCLGLHHEAIPPTVNHEKANPLIDFANSPFYVNDQLKPWPRGPRARFAGVTSLGVGGTNAHVVVGEAPRAAAKSAPDAGSQPAARQHELLVWSARNNRSLDDYQKRLDAFLRLQPAADLGDVACTLAFGRHAFARRRVAVCADRDEAMRVLGGEDARRVHTHTATANAQVVFLLPGGGAQYRHMGRDLYATDTVIQQHVDRGLELLAGKLDVDLREVWLGSSMSQADVEAAFDRPSVQLPAIFLLEYAMAQSWIAQGVKPTALFGHSLGENTAACLSGVLTMEQALQLVTLRGQLFERVERGGMISVPLSREDCEARLQANADLQNLDLATVNAPELCVVSGPVAELEQLTERLLADDVEAQRVRIDIAAHSRMLEPILADFRAFLRSLTLRAPQIPFVSNRSGTWIADEQATDPEYWVQHLRQTVHFADGADLLLQDERNVFLEVGPGRTLSSLVRLNPRWSQDRSAIPSLRHPEENVADDAYLTAAYGRLWAAGVELPLSAAIDEQRARLSLPTYAFRQERYWVEADEAGDAGEDATEVTRSDDLAEWLWQPRWRRAAGEASDADDQARWDDSRVDAEDESASDEDLPDLAGTWLVFVDGLSVCRRLAEAIKARGADVVEVHLGDAFAKLDEHRYALAPEAGREGYDALLQDLTASGRQVHGVVHAWMLTKDRSFRPGSSFFHRCEEQGFYSLFFLAQALGAEDDVPEEGRRIVVLANDLMGPEGGSGCPEKALLLGPSLVMPRELQNVTTAVVDIAPPAASGRRAKQADAHWRQLIRGLLGDVCSRDQGLFAHRDGVRFRRRHEARKLPEAELRAVPVRTGGTYVITGGLGGVGSLVAEWLAQNWQANVVLVSRRSLPARDRWDETLEQGGVDDATGRAIQQVRRLESAGATVHLGAADVADVVAMRALVANVRDRFGAIHGVFHAAGVLDDDLMAQKDQARMEHVLTPKVQGALVLDEVLGGEEPIDFLTLFSSTSAVLGPPGQVDYVAANAFLDAFARRRNAAGQRTIALQWGVWNRVGMSALGGSGQDSIDSTGGRPEVSDEPLFDERRQVGADEVVFSADYRTAEQWLLDQHRTEHGDALVPGTGYIEMAAQCLRGIGEQGPFEVRDLYFFEPLRVGDDEALPVRVRLRRSLEGYEFSVQSASAPDGGSDGWRTHAQARLLLHALPAAEAKDLQAIAARCEDVREAPAGGCGYLPSPQEAHLRFGQRWHVVRELRYGNGEALARLKLDDAFAGDCERYRLHPALLDLATGYAMELIDGYDAKSLWVPLTYRSVRVYGDLPAEFCSVVHNVAAVGKGGDLVSVDLELLDVATGAVLVAVAGFQMKRLAVGTQFGQQPATGRGDANVALSAAVSGGAGAHGSSAATQLLSDHIDKGIQPQEGMRALGRLLATRFGGENLLSPMPVPALLAEQERAQAPAAADGERFQRPDLGNDYVAPRDDLEQGLVHFWEDLLGIDSIGVTDDFFALGGHSLIAVRLFAKIKKAYRIDYPMSVLFEAPTIDGLAGMLRRDGVSGGEDGAAASGGSSDEAAPKARYRHLVPMQTGRAAGATMAADEPPATPFFLVAGMFGNVLNLRHLAQLVGEDRPFYGLQARGLFGDMEPHETFEEAARDYLEEVRQLQPHGPYLLGGFSGGGITAYEMARQLREAGEEVSMLVLLDTPLPTRSEVSRQDRLRIHAQRMRRDGPGYLWQWVRSRAAWELGKLRRRVGSSAEEQVPATFHSQVIEQAFRRQLGRYQMVEQPLRTWLFRPALDKRYKLAKGEHGSERFANEARELVLPDNGWTPFVGDLTVVETPGDHDSMVLEPNVRSLASVLRQAITEIEGVARAKQIEQATLLTTPS